MSAYNPMFMTQNPTMPYNPMQNPIERYQMLNQMQNNNIQSNMPSVPFQQPLNNLIRVTGYEGAKAYEMPPNSVVALFDGNDDVFYIKTSDGAGFSTIKVFDFFPRQESVAATTATTQGNTIDYATKQDLETMQAQIEELKGMIEDGKQFIPEQHAIEQKPQRGTSK